jgi:hypothetical protein
MPGCSLYLAGLDLWLGFAGSSSTLTAQFPIPPGVVCGLRLHATAVAFVQPNSLPNGMNPAGIVTSNGVRSVVGGY